jgi:hypothetical protein
MSISYKSILNTYCQKSHLPLPNYSCAEVDGQYQCTTSFNGIIFTEINPLKKNAIENCARKILINFDIDIDKLIDYKGLVISQCKHKKISEPIYICSGYVHGEYQLFCDFNNNRYTYSHQILVEAERLCAKQIYNDLLSYKVLMMIFINQKTSYEIIQNINNRIKDISNPREYKLIIISKNKIDSYISEIILKFHSVELYSNPNVCLLKDVDVEYIIF